MIKHRIVAGVLLAATAMTAAAPASAQRITRIYSFGDSYADTGIAKAVILADPLANAATKGQLAQVYPTGRFSGGTNYIDTLSYLLNAPVVNYAVGGAVAGTFPVPFGTGAASNVSCGPGGALGGSPDICPQGFTYQANQFLNVGVQNPLFPNVAGAASFGPHDLLAVSVGGNDARYYQQNYSTQASAPFIANSIAGATTGLNALVGAGARNISFLAGNTANLPEVAGNTAAQSVRNAYSTAFNTGIQSVLAGYAANGVIVNYTDLTLIGNNITANPTAYGLTSAGACAPTTSCLGSADLTNSFLFYVDALHLTSAGFAIVAKYIDRQLTAPLTLQAPSEAEMDTAHQFGRTLTTRMDLGSPRDGDMPEGLGVYLVGDTTSRTQRATDTNDQFKITSSGLSGGIEYGFGSGMVGAAVNVSRPKAKFFNDAARDEARTVQGGIYGGVGIAGGFVQGYAGIGRDRHDLTRVGVVQGMEARVHGHHLAAGAKGGFLIPFGVMRVGPVIAVDHARATVDGYTESGDLALTLNVGRERFTSTRGSAGAEMRGDFGVSGASVRPYFSAMLEKEFAHGSRVLDYAQTSAPGIVNHFRLSDTSKRPYGRLAAGLSAGITSMLSINADVSGTVAKRYGNDTSGHVSLRAAF